jgi:tetratricopeptide (TPR) repeat protein
MLNEAEKNLESLLEIDPLKHHARFEHYLLNPVPESLLSFTSAIRNELPHETYLELAFEYANRGLTDEAIQVLEQSPEYPTVYYWLAYLCRMKSPEKSKQYLIQAAEMSPLMVFPFRLETIPVLTWAQEQHPSWKTNYYLGLIFWKILRTGKAKEKFEQCGNAPDFAPFYIARGLLFQHNKFGYDIAGSDFTQALELAPEEWRTWYYLTGYYQSIGAFKQELEISEQMYAHFPDNPIVGISHAKSLLNSSKNKECLKVLAEVNILPAEFANAGHGIYERANLKIALDLLKKKKFKQAIEYINYSKKWPENLGSGEPYEPDIRLQDYLSAYCDTELGNYEAADKYYQHIIDYSRNHWNATEDLFNNYFATSTLIAQGESEEAGTYIKNWEKEQNYLRDWKIAGGSSTPEVQWVLAKYYNEKEKAGKLEEEITENRPNSKFSILIRAIKLTGM